MLSGAMNTRILRHFIGKPAGQLHFLRSYKSPAANHGNFLFIALGNPSPEYSGTRHNVGQWALRHLVNNRLLPEFSGFQKSKALGIEASLNSPKNNVLLVNTVSNYMNVSGPPVLKVWQRFLRQHNNEKCHLIVIHDELEIHIGKVQVRRRKTSARGHNGLRSIDKCLGNDYTKIGIGVGKPTRGEVSEHVLSRFSNKEREVLETVSLPLVTAHIRAILGGEYIYESR